MGHSFGSKDVQVHVANAFGRDLWVLAMPNADWVFADITSAIAVTVVTAVATAGTGAAAAAGGAAETAKQISTVREIYNAIMELRAVKAMLAVAEQTSTVRSVASTVSKAYDIASNSVLASQQRTSKSTANIRKFLDDSAVRVPRGQAVRVFEDSTLKVWRALNPSYWGALAGASTVTLLVVDETFEYIAQFNTGPDDSWIVKPEHIVRAKYGSLWRESPGDGLKHWGTQAEWKGVEWPEGVDAAFNVRKHDSDKAYLFNFTRQEYIRYDLVEDCADAGYPKPIDQVWSALPWRNRFDAAVADGDVAWFFKGDEYIRYRLDTDTVSSGYPRKIAGGWRGLWEKVDTAIARGASDEVFFFNFDRDEFLRYNLENDRVDRGFPKSIKAEWKGLPERFTAAVHGKHRVPTLGEMTSCPKHWFFFKGFQYWRWDVDPDTVSPGYPKDIGSKTSIDPTARRPPGLAVMPHGNTLWPENLLRAGDYELAHQDDGNLAIYESGSRKVKWTVNEYKNKPGRFSIENDGSLVLRDRAGEERWRSQGKNGAGLGVGACLVLHEDGVACLYAASGERLWCSEATSAERPDVSRYCAKPRDREALLVGEDLYPGEELVSKNKRYRCSLEFDGRITVRAVEGDRALWSSDARSGAVARLIMQDDCNLVVYGRDKEVVWAGNHHGLACRPNAGGTLVMQDDGNLVVYSSSGDAVWATHTMQST